MKKYWFLVMFLSLALVIAFGFTAACDDDDDDDDDDDVADDDMGDDDIGDDDMGDDDVADDDVADDDVADDDVADDDVTDDDVVDDDMGDDDTYANEQDVVVNGGFETGEILPWIGEWEGGIVYGPDDEFNAYSGDYAVWLGGRSGESWEWIGQQLTMPANLVGVQVKCFWKIFKVFSCTGSFEIAIYDSDNATKLMQLGYWTHDDAGGMINPWQEFDYTLSSTEVDLVEGKNVFLRYDLHSSGTLLANFNAYVDAVEYWIRY